LHTQSKYRLLVVRLGAMGDILHALPAVTALRQAHPKWIIDWAVEPKWSALLATANSLDRDTGTPAPRRPVVDRLLLAPTRQWRRQPLAPATMSGLGALRRELRAGAYDVVLDLQGAIRSAVIGRMAGCRRFIGEAEPRERAARWLFTERVATHGAHVIEQDLELASAVAGDDLSPVAPCLPVDDAAEAWAEGFLPPALAPRSALINPGAGWGAKRWPVERYAAVAQALVDQGFRVLVNAGPGEESLAGVIVKQTGGAAIPILASLEQLISVTRRIGVVVAGDTGPLHLASALGRPVIGIYGPTDPARNGPFGTRSRVLRSPESRRDHKRHAQPEAGLLTITPDAVLQAVDGLLAEETIA
jgi:heptosyltransferase-1